MDNPLLCIVEIPKGSRNKYEYDADLLVFDRFLSASVVFPTDYGFIRGAYSADGDPMDVLITVSDPVPPAPRGAVVTYGGERLFISSPS